MLYKLNRNNIQRSERTEIASLSEFELKEKDLENFLSSHLTDVVFEDELMLIGQERVFQAEADLLALDKDGVLYIFELKRWESRQENVLQVLRYGQTFGRYTYDDLESLARRHGKLKSDWSLSAAHQAFFGVSLSTTDFNRDQVFVLVTNGADEETISALSYWSSKGLKIFCMPYDVFKINEEPYLQMRPYNPTGAPVVERNTGYYIVNTNAKYLPDAWKEMIGNRNSGKAAAYGDRKDAVRRILHGSTVYLYHSGVGVIAKGESSSSVQDDGDECSVSLKFEWVHGQDEWHSKAPTAREINQRLGRGYRFLQTVFSISKEMAEKIDEIEKEKRQCKNEDTGAPVVERNTGYYIVNTNVSYMADAWKKMIGDRKNGKATAYGDRKDDVRRIPRGSTVYLYHNGVGVIAKGEATSSVQDDGDEYSVSLKFEWVHGQDEWHSKAPTAREINQRLGGRYTFRGTVLLIGKEMAEKIDEIEKEKRQCKNENS